MAIAFVTGGNNSGTSTTRSAALGAATAIGNLLFVSCMSLSTTGVTMTILDNQGNVWTPIIQVSAGPSVYCWWAIAKNANVVTYTVTLSASVAAASVALAYSGTDTTSPVSTSNHGTGTSTAPLGGSVTTPRANCFVISHMTPAAGTITNPTGYTNRESTGTVVSNSGDSAEATAGAYNPAWTLSASNKWEAINVVITPPFSHGAPTLMMTGVGM
jgi:hypothetical protein